MADGLQTYHPALPRGAGPSCGRAREDGTGRAALWSSRCAARGYRLAAPPAKRTEHDRTVAAARGTLGEDTFTAAWVRGYALPLKEATTDTLSNDEQ